MNASSIKESERTARPGGPEAAADAPGIAGAAAVTLRVQVNDQAIALPAGSSLADALRGLAIEPASVATALNGSFVGREARVATPLSDGDRIACFQAIVGG